MAPKRKADDDASSSRTAKKAKRAEKAKYFHPSILAKGEKYEDYLDDWVNKYRTLYDQFGKPFAYGKIKRQIRTLLLGTVYFHSQDKCLRSSMFEVENLVVGGDRIMFREVKLRSYSDDRADSDLKRLREVILKEVFHGHEIHELPADLHGFLMILDKDHPRLYVGLLKVHVSLMMGSGMRTFLVQSWLQSRDLDFHEWSDFERRVCDKLSPPAIWKAAALSVPEIAQVYAGGSYGDHYNTQVICWKNLMGHLLDYVWKDEYGQTGGVARRYTDVRVQNHMYHDCVNMVFALFAEEISRFQEYMFEEGLLNRMRLQEIFHEGDC